LVVLVLWSCGSEPTDRPQDCRENQYYDEGTRRCRTCPAVVEPECRPGCEPQVESDQRGCPVLRCDELCEGCEGDLIWDDEAEMCVEPGDDPDANTA
jgi:hypothetical protein